MGEPGIRKRAPELPRQVIATTQHQRFDQPGACSVQPLDAPGNRLANSKAPEARLVEDTGMPDAEDPRTVHLTHGNDDGTGRHREVEPDTHLAVAIGLGVEHGGPRRSRPTRGVVHPKLRRHPARRPPHRTRRCALPSLPRPRSHAHRHTGHQHCRPGLPPGGHGDGARNQNRPRRHRNEEAGPETGPIRDGNLCDGRERHPPLT
jgi:hypothetical protein